MAFPRTNATVLTATAGAHFRFVCVCASRSSQPLPQDDDGGYLPQCLLPHAARHEQANCLPVKTHLAKLPSQGERLRTAEDR